MNDQKIAILVDSCTDVPDSFIDEYQIFMVPMKIVYRDNEFEDRVNISAQQVYDRLVDEVPKTATPTAGILMNAFEDIREKGYESVIAVSISSGLSGTYSLVCETAKRFPELRVEAVDTRSIGIGAGIQAIYAGKLIKQGLPFEVIVKKLRDSAEHSRVYFCLSTLEYLKRGGRIGKVAAILGSILHIKPVITCNQEGAYCIAATVRGRAKALAETINLAIGNLRENVEYTIAVAHGSAVEEASRVLEELKKRLPDCSMFIECEVSPALGVHTGPGLVGVGVQLLM